MAAEIEEASFEGKEALFLDAESRVQAQLEVNKRDTLPPAHFHNG